MSQTYDYVVVGAGTGGLSVASLLARSGARVALLEAHDAPGGCAHTFDMGRYSFCAAVHYIFWCGEGQPVHQVLRYLGLDETVRFHRLDPEGYDHFSCPSAGVSFRIPSDLDRLAAALLDRYPEEHQALRTYFRVLRRILLDLEDAPEELSVAELIKAALTRPTLARTLRWTLKDLMDHAGLGPEVRAVLATQVGDLGLPPEQVSAVLFAALVAAYGSGAWHPEQHFSHLIESMADVVRQAPGCVVELSTEVVGIDVEHGRATGVRTADGRRFRAGTVITDIDPRAVVALAGRQHFTPDFLDKLDFEDSTSAFSLYLGLQGIDLRQHGFGDFNIWHYPDLDIDAVYRRQNVDGDLSDPWLFLSSPTLLAGTPPADEPAEERQVLLAVTTAAYAPWSALAADKHAYSRAKVEVRERILDILEKHYVPGLREHIKVRVTGSPTTFRRFLRSSAGSIYGPELSPANAALGRVRAQTPIEGLFLTGAAAAYPSVGATIAGGAKLFTQLTGQALDSRAIRGESLAKE